MENDAIFEIAVQQCTLAQRNVVKHRIHVFQRADLNLQSESHLQNTVATPSPSDLHFVAIVQLKIDLRDGDVLLRVKVIREVLEGEHLLVEDDTLTCIDSAK